MTELNTDETAGPPAKRRILIVDDEPSITLIVKLNLEETGNYDVREQNDASLAVDTVREFLPDLILMDVMMPEMDGGDIASLLHADPELKNIPIVFLTATILKEEAEAKGGVVGGYPFLAKPVSADELVECVEKNLDRPTTPQPAS